MNPPSHNMQPIGVIGAGAWGTALARHLASNGMKVTLWAYEAEVVEAMRSKQENTMYLPGIHLPSGVHATGSLGQAFEAAQVLILAVPSHAMRIIVQQLQPLCSTPFPLIIATKGLEEGSSLLMSQVVEEILSSDWRQFLSVLSGPSFAMEVSEGRPTTILLAGRDPTLVQRLQALLMTPTFRVYAANDLIGAQVGGALKNVMAIAAGIVDGLELGYDARAALITRGLAEMVRLAMSMGAEEQTLYGLSGLGDLVLTCTGPLSRNYTVGKKLAEGRHLEEIRKETPTVAEGIRTTRAAMLLANRFEVEMPIVRAVHAVLFENQKPFQAVSDLMTRAAKAEAAK